MGMRNIITALRFWFRENMSLKKHLILENEAGCIIKAPFYQNKIDFPACKISKYDFKEACYATNLDQNHAIKFIRIVQPGSKKIKPEKGTLYIFLYNKKEKRRFVLHKYSKELLSSGIIATLIEMPMLQILFNKKVLDQPNGPILLRICTRVGFIERALGIFTIFLVVFLVYYLNFKLLQLFEEKDPFYTDFVISSASLVKYKDLLPNDTVNCMICFDEFKGEDEVRLLGCKHFFHPECIDRWLIGHSNCCPYCRLEIPVCERA